MIVRRSFQLPIALEVVWTPRPASATVVDLLPRPFTCQGFVVSLHCMPFIVEIGE